MTKRKRFVENTLPLIATMITILIMTHVVGVIGGMIGIVLYAFVDVVFCSYD